MLDRSKLLRAGFSALLVATLAAPALAAPGDSDRLTVTATLAPGSARELVSFVDLNLTRASDQRQLHRRVSAASLRVCTPQALAVSVSDEDYAECSRTARRGALPQVEQAIARAQQLASNGTSDIPAVAIAIVGA